MIIPNTKPAEQLLHHFCEAYKNRDLPTLLNLFTQNINMWGTGLDEHRVGLKEVEDQLKRDWSQSDQGAIEIVSFIPTPNNSLWSAVICRAKVVINGEEHVFDQLRGTVTIEKEDGMWKISHMHCSFPDYRNIENGSFPVNS